MKRSTLPLAAVLVVLAGCVSDPGTPYSLDTAPLAFVDETRRATEDGRGRFREIFCAVNDAVGRELPNYRPCEDILHRFADEAAGPGDPVDLAAPRAPHPIAVVAGLGAQCFGTIVQPFPLALARLRSLGHRTSAIEVDGLSSSASNARQIRDAVRDMGLARGERLILVGYSKGTPDILEALAAYPELSDRVAAVISVAGAVNGSPLSYDAPQWMVSLLEGLPGSPCSGGDGGAVESLKPSVRRRFAASHELPDDVGYYALGSFARRNEISILLQGTYDELSQTDPRNDGQMIFYDQVIPGGTLLGFVKSDHWAVALPLTRQHPNLAPDLLNHNEFPREVLLESAVRFVEERLLSEPPGSAPAKAGADRES